MFYKFLWLSVIIYHCWCKTLNPVILVPGDGGSEFMAKLNKTSAPHSWCELTTDYYFSLWLNLEELAPYIIDCFTDNMRVVYNRETHTTSNAPGVDIQIPGWGDTETVEWLDPSHISPTSYFTNIVNAMVSWGYQRKVSVRGAPYDFRKAPNEYGDFYKNLQNLIEETYTLNNNTKVVLLGHSMGNPTTLYFLNHMPQSWKDKFIQSFVSLAGVWGGSVKPLRLFASGDNLGVAFVKAINCRIQQRSMPSTAWLMPSDMFWGKDDVLVERPGRNYTVNDYKQFFQDIDFMDGWYMRQDTKDLVRSVTPPGVEVHCLHGYGVPTPGTLVYTDAMWPDSQPNVRADDGDGTVNIRSLLGCLRWQGKQKQKVIHEQFKGAEHMEILQNKDVLAYLKKYLTS